jgi:hypothetical protein
MVAILSKRSPEFRQRLEPIFGMVRRQDAGLETSSKAAVVVKECQSVHPLLHLVRARSHGCCWNWLNPGREWRLAKLRPEAKWACRCQLWRAMGPSRSILGEPNAARRLVPAASSTGSSKRSHRQAGTRWRRTGEIWELAK